MNIQQDHNATIGDTFNALTDSTRQLVLISEKIATNQMRSSGTSQPVPTVTLTLFTYFILLNQEHIQFLFLIFQEHLQIIIRLIFS